MITRFATALIAILMCQAFVLVQARADSACEAGSSAGQASVVINGYCTGVVSSTGAPVSASSGPQTKTLICGSPSSQDNALWDARCGPPRACPGGLAFATFIEQHGQWVLLSSWCPGQAANARPPVPTAADLREQVLRLLPTVRIGSAWTARALVNAETVLWAQTDANRNLGTVTVVGRQVALKIAFDHADWDFGDGATDQTTDPGKAYSRADPCNTAQCADYYGHTYRDVGPVAITLTVAWHAQFSLDNGTTWTDVDAAPLAGPQATHDLTVVQARGIIVKNP
jgi:hypothetical protein